MAKEQDNKNKETTNVVKTSQELNDADIMFLLEQAKRVDEESIAKIARIKNMSYSLVKEII